MLKRLRTYSSNLRFYINRWGGFCPRPEDIENIKIKYLATRLKADSYQETLTNILEWENRNIEFWAERHPLPSVLRYILIIFSGILFLFYLGFLISIILISFFNIKILCFIQNLVSFFNIWIFSLCSSLITLFAIMASIMYFNRKIPLRELPSGLKNAFRQSISIEFLLDNKLGVCRDYAKLTACLLSNAYPDNNVFFAYAPDHVATGIMIDKDYYMLDQRLPILTIEKWTNYRKARTIDQIKGYVSTNHTLELLDKANMVPEKSDLKLDIEKLTIKMIDLLKINNQDYNTTALRQVEIPWKNGVKMYENDEFVNYSLARFIKMKAINELVPLEKVRKFSINIDEPDIIFNLAYI